MRRTGILLIIGVMAMFAPPFVAQGQAPSIVPPGLLRVDLVGGLMGSFTGEHALSAWPDRSRHHSQTLIKAEERLNEAFDLFGQVAEGSQKKVFTRPPDSPL